MIGPGHQLGGKIPELKENLFSQLNVDQLHTLATALGNTITRLQERIAAADDPELGQYLHRCSNDASVLLYYCNQSFVDLERAAVKVIKQQINCDHQWATDTFSTYCIKCGFNRKPAGSSGSRD